jgi:hypothetical protein
VVLPPRRRVKVRGGSADATASPARRHDRQGTGAPLVAGDFGKPHRHGRSAHEEPELVVNLKFGESVFECPVDVDRVCS